MAVAMDYCNTVDSNIRVFLKDKTHRMDVHLETARNDFQDSCEHVGAVVDLPAALREFDTRHNASAR